MAFNAGGTNVGGVQVINSGILTIPNYVDTTISADGTSATTIVTVGAGKVLRLKNIRTFKSSGTFTVASTRVILVMPGGARSIVVYESAAAGNIAQNLSPLNIELPAGWKLDISTTVTGLTVAGDIRTTILYDEITI